MYRRVFLVVLSICLIISMCGCGSVKELVGKDEEEQSQVEVSKNVNLAMSRVKTLNPVLSQDKDSYYISKLVYQSLFKLDEDLSPQNDLVKKCKIGSSGKTVTLELDTKAKFSDGTKVKADDVKFTVEAIQQEGKKSLFYSNVSGISEVKLLGDNKLKIKFMDAGGGICKLTFPILPKHLYKNGKIGKKKSSFRPVGSGQYKVSSYDKEKSLVLVANENYSGEKAKNKLNFTIYDDMSTVINLLEGNLVSYAINETIDRQTQIGSNNLRYGEFNSGKLVFVGFNCSVSYLKQKKVRQALCYAIDSDSLLKKAFYGSGTLTDSILFPNYLGIKNSGDMYEYNKKKAKEMLEDAGWKDRNKDGYLDKKKGKNIELKILVSEDDSRKALAALLASNLDDIDVRCNIVQCKEKEFVKKLKKGKFDLYIGEMSFGDYYDINSFVGGMSDFTSYENEELMKCARKTAACMSLEEQKKNVEALKSLMKDGVPYYPLFYRTYSYVISDELSGEIHPIISNIYNGCGGWTCEYEIEEDGKASK